MSKFYETNVKDVKTGKNYPNYKEWNANHIAKGLHYKDMLGDGDSSTYSAITKSKPYGDDSILNKLQCIGHAQARLGIRLQKLKNTKKSVKLSDSKGFGGEQRLTDSKIDILQNYYGLAVRSNLDHVDKMATAIKTTLFHVASTESNPQHDLCPDGDNSWCGYKREKEFYQHKNGISQCTVDEIGLVFQDLSTSDLLQKYTRGLTQNVNECLNGLIWDRCLKTIYVDQSTVGLATYLAVLKFSDGDISFLKIFEDLDIKPGVFTFEGAHPTMILAKQNGDWKRRVLTRTPMSRTVRV